MNDYLTIDGVRALAVCVAAVGQAAMAYWPDMRNWKNTITTRSAKLDTPVVPFGPFFGIWIIIFTSCIGFAIWHGLPGNLNDPYLRSVGWLAVALFAGNIAWEAYVPRYGFKWPSVFLILVELLTSLAILVIITTTTGSYSGFDYWLGVAPLQFFAGWVSVATFVSLSSTLVLENSKFNPREGLFASTLILFAGLFVLAVFFWTSSGVYITSAIWGLLGIIVGTRIKNEPLLATFSATFSIAIIMSAFLIIKFFG